MAAANSMYQELQLAEHGDFVVYPELSLVGVDTRVYQLQKYWEMEADLRLHLRNLEAFATPEYLAEWYTNNVLNLTALQQNQLIETNDSNYIKTPPLIFLSPETGQAFSISPSNSNNLLAMRELGRMEIEELKALTPSMSPEVEDLGERKSKECPSEVIQLLRNLSLSNPLESTYLQSILHDQLGFNPCIEETSQPLPTLPLTLGFNPSIEETSPPLPTLPVTVVNGNFASPKPQPTQPHAGDIPVFKVPLYGNSEVNTMVAMHNFFDTGTVKGKQYPPGKQWDSVDHKSISLSRRLWLKKTRATRMRCKRVTVQLELRLLRDANGTMESVTSEVAEEFRIWRSALPIMNEQGKKNKRALSAWLDAVRKDPVWGLEKMKERLPVEEVTALTAKGIILS